MFEQSIVSKKAAELSWTFAVATLLEIGAIAAAILAPLFLIAPLPNVPPVPRPMAHYLPHVKIVRVEPADVRRPPVIHIIRPAWANATLVAPRQIPHSIATLSTLEPIDISSTSGLASGASDAASYFGSDSPEIAPPPVTKAQPKEHPTPLHVSQGVQEAKLIHRVMPRYPALASQTREFGTVHLVAIIGKDGRVSSVQVLDGPVFLRQAAVEAIKQWVYQPTLLNGQPVEVIAPIDVHFTLNN